MSETMHEYVIRKLHENKGRISRICEVLDIKVSTAHSIANGKSENPGIKIIQKLHDYFQRSGE